jgi:hypothetical protein
MKPNQCTATVKASNFAPRGNFELFFTSGLLTSEFVPQKTKENISFRESLELQTKFY